MNKSQSYCGFESTLKKYKNDFAYYFYILIFVSTCITKSLFADEPGQHLPEWQAMKQHYKDQRSKSHALFYSAPSFHIIPQRNIVTITADFENRDLLLQPGEKSYAPQAVGAAPDKYLSLKGYQASPLIGLAADRFGIGLTSHIGKFESEYSYSHGPGFATSQKSKVTSSGVGAYLYFMPKLGFVPKFVNATFIVGYNKINVIHRFTGTSFSESEVEEFDSYRYEVKKLDYGFNLSILLARYFTLQPWVNYTQRILGTPLDGSGNSIEYNPQYYSGLIADQEFIWDTDPRYVWGLDFALRLGRFDVHLGGLFGLIGNSAQGSDRIEDRSAKISLTYSFKSR
ncbi:MAG: hypothetical protein KBD78_10210 [Oligoflexales bacterium]|nr:hypothetical protein [Oligoflexales bacterium]